MAKTSTHECKSSILIVVFINIPAEIVDTQPQLGALLVVHLKVCDAIHLEVLRNVEVVCDSLLPASPIAKRG